MNNSKRAKIQAKLDHHSTPEHEKEVCRKILEDNPVADRPPFVATGKYAPPPNGDFWQQAANQQQAAAQAQRQAAAQAQAAQAQQGFYNGMFSGLGGGVFGAFGIFGENKKKPCEQCGNNFFIKTEKDLYCPICLSAKRKEAAG